MSIQVTPTQIRITDPVVMRMVVEEQKRLGDSTPTRTAGRIIERYFAMLRQSQPAQPAAA